MSKQVNQVLDGIFEQHRKLFQTAQIKPKIKAKPNQQKEIELAVTVLLVDLASSDQHFDMVEYNAISSGLMRIFGTTREEVQALVNKANLIMANLRGTSRFSDLLKNNLSLDERKLVMELIEQVINADGQVDGFEVYMKNKFATQLGLEEKK